MRLDDAIMYGPAWVQLYAAKLHVAIHGVENNLETDVIGYQHFYDD